MGTQAIPIGVQTMEPDLPIEEFSGFLTNLNVQVPRQLVLINPPAIPEESFDLDRARNGAYFCYPPLGLLSIAAVAKEIDPGIDVRIIDLNFEMLRHSQSNDFSYDHWKGLLSDVLSTCDALHVGVTYMFGTCRTPFIDVTTYIRENFPDAVILSGGVQATYDHQDILDRGLCDIVFRREGEIQFKAFLESCIAGSPVNIPMGCAFRYNGKSYEIGEAEKDIPTDWDLTPFYSQVDVHNYHKYGATGFSNFNGRETPFATVLTNRGCRARCTFCTVRDFNGFGIKQRPVESVLNEMKFLVNEKGIKQIDFIDDDLLWNPSRAVELFQGMAKELPGLKWTSTNGLIAAGISDEVMYWMAESGVTAFAIGIESGNDKMLHTIKKPTTKPKLREKRELFKQYPDVYVSANFIIGFPNETFGEMMDSFKFAAELQWDWCTWNVCQPLKGTDQFDAFKELGDDRCDEESYSKTLNPGRSAPGTDLDSLFKGGQADVLTGRDVFNLPYDEIPSSDQLKEIWFTFNLVVNFLNNLNFAPGGNPAKIVKWLEAINFGYPRDASISAALVKTYKLLGDEDNASLFRKKFDSLLSGSEYWQRRVREFPELLDYAGATTTTD